MPAGTDNVIILFSPALLAAILSFVLTPLARKISIAAGAMDEPGPRKVHTVPIPRLGGLAVVAAAYAAGTFLWFLSEGTASGAPGRIFLALAVGALPILAVSIRDDIHSLGVTPRLAAHLLGAAIAVALGVRLNPTIHLFSLEITIGWLAIPLSLLWIIGVTNAFNLVDGLDGLSAGLALISAVSLAAVSLVTRSPEMAAAALVVAGALLGFLPRNIFPARVFLGDTGATVTGFWLACLALRGSATLSAGMAVLIPVLLLGVPITETLLSMLRRFAAGRAEGAGGVLEPDRRHIHHRLIDSGMSQPRAVLFLYGAGLLAAAIGFVSLFLTTGWAALLLAALVLAAGIGIRRLNYGEFFTMRLALFPAFFDLLFAAIAMFVAARVTASRWPAGVTPPRALVLFAAAAPATAILFWLFGLYRGRWAGTSRVEFCRRSLAALAAGAAGYGLVRLSVATSAPLEMGALYTLFLVILINVARIAAGVVQTSRK